MKLCVYLCFVVSFFCVIEGDDALTAVSKRMSAMFRNRIGRRTIDRRKKEICYDIVGCFPADRALKKAPQPPSVVQTRFLLYTRERKSEDGELMAYGDDRSSLSRSAFKLGKPVRFLVHGFKGSGRDKGAKAIANAILEIEDSNVILLDWEKGAAGPSYRLSAANTQLVGKQLALFLFDLISIGASPSSIHLIGFSLGAHIAGFAGRELLSKGIRLSRITGLDPASPLFRENFAATSMPALNDQDAALVDVIHTDGAALWTQGFGLLKALGHVDFFPNGGSDQPGCSHVFASVLVSHLEGTVNSTTVCNHIRGFQLFLESIPRPTESSCRFKAWPCPSRDSFFRGACFPSPQCSLNSTDGSCGVMGYSADVGLARGPLYLVTRDSPPFCGDQLQATVSITLPIQFRSTSSPRLVLTAPTAVTPFKLHAQAPTSFKSRVQSPGKLRLRNSRTPIEDFTFEDKLYRGLSTAVYDSFPSSAESNNATLSVKIFIPGRYNAGEIPSVLNYVKIASTEGITWSYCGNERFSTNTQDISSVSVNLTPGHC